MKKKISIESKDLGYRSVVLSYEEASTLKLLVSGKLAEMYHAKDDYLPSNRCYFNQLLLLKKRLDDLVFAFVDDLSF